ncbi:transposon ty3-I gag-pol polyprotein [Tanacetum coccineum]
MAEHTRLKELATTVERLVESNTQRDNREVAHDNRLQHVETSLETIQRTLDTLTRGIDRLFVSQSQPQFNRNTNQNSLQVPHVKLDFPHFDGSDPLNWLFRAEQFFTYYETPDVQRLTIASVHFEGSVIPWFQMLQKANQIPTWDALASAIEEHFGLSQYKSPRAQLFKLTQTTSAADYYHQFTVMANRVEGLSPEALLDCFLSGLKDHIRRDVIAQDPKSLIHAGSLSRLFDEKQPVTYTSKPKFSTPPILPKTSHLNSSTSTNFSSHPPRPSPLPPLLPTPQTKPLPPIKKLSPAEMQLRREKGLCFTCNDKYTWNHKCPNKQALLLMTSPDDYDSSPLLIEPAEEKLDAISCPQETTEPHLSLNAYHGYNGVATIRLCGSINSTKVQVLLDGGSSDNFIQPRVAKHVEGLITSIPLYVQNELIKFSAYVLPISGADIILGAAWLATLGPHLADYSSATIKFYLDDKFITLTGDTSLLPAQAQFHHFKRLSATDAIAEAYTLHCFSMETSSDDPLQVPDSVPHDLGNILHVFSFVFSVPTGLPPLALGNGYLTKGRKIKQKRTKPSTEWKSVKKSKSTPTNRSQSRNLKPSTQDRHRIFVEPFNLEEPIENPAPPVVTMDDNRTMAQLLEAPTEGYEDAIVVPEITADNFELKHGLLTLVQNKQFFGHDKEDPHAHIRYFNKITSTMKFPNVPSTSVKLMLFLFSLEGAARIWLEKEPPRSILTWDDLVSKFINKFFPPSKTTNLRNEITRFQQRFDETFYEAWDRFNDLLRACSGTLPSNTVTNLKEDLKGITIRSGVAYKGLTIPTTSSPKVVERETEVTKDTMPPTNNGSTEDVQPLVVHVENHELISEPVVAPVSAPMPNQRISILYPSRRNDERNREKANDQIKKFYKIFQDMKDDPTSPEVDPTYYDTDGDILLLEAILNIKEHHPEVELKDLPPYLEYAFLEGNDKLPVIIAKDLKNEEKTALIKVLKSHKRAIAWKLSNIKGIDPEFCTHKILMEEDYKPTVQHQRRSMGKPGALCTEEGWHDRRKE